LPQRKKSQKIRGEKTKKKKKGKEGRGLDWTD
jgi:hypothetical protein